MTITIMLHRFRLLFRLPPLLLIVSCHPIALVRRILALAILARYQAAPWTLDSHVVLFGGVTCKDKVSI